MKGVTLSHRNITLHQVLLITLRPLPSCSDTMQGNRCHIRWPVRLHTVLRRHQTVLPMIDGRWPDRYILRDGDSLTRTKHSTRGNFAENEMVLPVQITHISKSAQSIHLFPSKLYKMPLPAALGAIIDMQGTHPARAEKRLVADLHISRLTSTTSSSAHTPPTCRHQKVH